MFLLAQNFLNLANSVFGFLDKYNSREQLFNWIAPSRFHQILWIAFYLNHVFFSCCTNALELITKFFGGILTWASKFVHDKCIEYLNRVISRRFKTRILVRDRNPPCSHMKRTVFIESSYLLCAESLSTCLNSECRICATFWKLHFIECVNYGSLNSFHIILIHFLFHSLPPWLNCSFSIEIGHQW